MAIPIVCAERYKHSYATGLIEYQLIITSNIMC